MFVWVSGNGDVRVWDCHTGRCVDQGNLGAQIGFLISQGPWLFAGLRNLVKAWNLKTEMQYSIDGPVGQVYALEATTGRCAFCWDGGRKHIYLEMQSRKQLISVDFNFERSHCQRPFTASRMQSWDLDTLTCSQTLLGHSAAVASLIWACGKDGSMGVTHTRDEEHPILALFGMDDAYDKPILCCSCNDNSAILYELPSSPKIVRFGSHRLRSCYMGLRGGLSRPLLVLYLCKPFRFGRKPVGDPLNPNALSPERVGSHWWNLATGIG
uniref:Uncharacterized protein n=1 Tax=Vitis vinifera TaxID=29760 RepID=A5BDI1_VITVI|nr:hypothetical protein VITISV_001315 [Vitis vinifera]